MISQRLIILLHESKLLILHVCAVSDDSCTVTPLSSILLTATSGRLYDGMKNVKINCKCANQGYNMWYYPNGTSIPLQLSSSLNSSQIMQQNGTLIIPRFSQLHEGTYYCWANDSSIGSHITLELLNGKHMHKIVMLQL